jgi:hypothetical protein
MRTAVTPDSWLFANVVDGHLQTLYEFHLHGCNSLFILEIDCGIALGGEKRALQVRRMLAKTLCGRGIEGIEDLKRVGRSRRSTTTMVRPPRARGGPGQTAPVASDIDPAPVGSMSDAHNSRRNLWRHRQKTARPLQTTF